MRTVERNTTIQMARFIRTRDGCHMSIVPRLRRRWRPRLHYRSVPNRGAFGTRLEMQKPYSHVWGESKVKHRRRSVVSRSQPFWWRRLKLKGLCVSCWHVRDRPGALCRKCCENAKLHARRKRGWDGVSEWKPKRHGRAPRHFVGCSLPRPDYRLLLRLVARDKTTRGTIIREAVQAYLRDIFEKVG